MPLHFTEGKGEKFGDPDPGLSYLCSACNSQGGIPHKKQKGGEIRIGHSSPSSLRGSFAAFSLEELKRDSLDFQEGKYQAENPFPTIL